MCCLAWPTLSCYTLGWFSNVRSYHLDLECVHFSLLGGGGSRKAEAVFLEFSNKTILFDDYYKKSWRWWWWDAHCKLYSIAIFHRHLLSLNILVIIPNPLHAQSALHHDIIIVMIFDSLLKPLRQLSFRIKRITSALFSF